MNVDPQTIKTYNVWQKKEQTILLEVIEVWNRLKVLPPDIEPISRAQEVVSIARDEQDRIVGITTAKLMVYPPLKNQLFLLRGLLVPECRIPGLFTKMIIETLQILEEDVVKMKQSGKPIGVFAEIENQRLKQANLTQLASGMSLLGFSQKDNPIYIYYFKGARY